MLRLVIPVLLILVIMYLIMFLNIRKRRQRSQEELPHYRNTYVKRPENIAQQQNASNRRQNYVAKYNATVDYIEKEVPEQKEEQEKTKEI